MLMQEKDLRALGRPGKGLVVAMGYRFTITGLRLAEGQLMITAVAAGPVPAMENAPVTIFGEDGTGFCQGEGGEGFGLTFPGCRKGEIAMATIRVTMAEVK